MRILLITMTALAVAAPVASAAIPVEVRIEGANRTVFEGPVSSEVRKVRASSDAGAPHDCDGVGGTPVPSATSVAADALALQGQDFDGTWYGGYQDYLVTRFGPESSSAWGLYHNDVRSTVGGCQLGLAAGDKVLWATNTGGGATGVLRMTVAGANPYTVTATDANGVPVAGATVYDADAAGVLASTGASTNASGAASVTLRPGYHRLKVGKSGYVRSARAVVCVEPCGATPADVPLRSATDTVLVSKAIFSRSGYRRGLVRLRWRLARRGVGIRSWAIESDDLSTGARASRTRARGRSATSASLRLPAGRVHALRFAWTDRLLRPGQADFGRVLVPIDDRSKSLRRRGPWRKLRSSKAWRGTVLRGRRGARLKVRLRAGRPALVLRGRRRATVRIGSKRVRVRGGRTALGAKRRKAGSVTITVVGGIIDLDGVAASP